VVTTTPFRAVVAYHAVLGSTCAAVFVLTTTVLGRLVAEPSETRSVGAIWAVVATIYVFHESAADRRRALVSRFAATALSFVLCEIYVLLLPFAVWGLAIAVAVGGVVVTLLGRPEDAGLTAITTTVVLGVVSAAPHEQVWAQPLLRLVDTAFGALIGFGVASLRGAAGRALADREGGRPWA
jgi:hypothetical protein